MQLGDTIRQLRRAAGLSQVEFAKQLNITASYLSLVEKSKREPTIPLLRKMARVLGTPAALLMAAALVDQVEPKAGAEEWNVVRHLVEAARALLVADQLDRKLLRPAFEQPTGGQTSD